MRILAIGDPHFKTDNLPDVNLFVSRVLNIIDTTPVDRVILLGDVLHYHERIYTNVANKAYSFIQEMAKRVRVYVLVGNHDYINNSQFMTDNHWMNAMKHWENVVIVDRAMVSDGVCMCPYVPPGRFKEALSSVNWQNCPIIFCHQEIRGCKMGAIISTEGDEWETTLPLIISGHIHDKQQPQPNVFYTGSSMQHAFGESHDKTITLCDTNTLHLEHISLDLPRRRILYQTIDQASKFTVPKTNDHIRLSVKGTLADFTTFRKSKKYKQLCESGVKIVFKPIAPETNVVEDSHICFDQILWSMVENQPELAKLYIYLKK